MHKDAQKCKGILAFSGNLSAENSNCLRDLDPRYPSFQNVCLAHTPCVGAPAHSHWRKGAQMHTAECDISVSKLLGFETFPFFWMVSVSVSKILVSKKNIGTSFKKIWYRKKYRIRFRKILVSKRVSDLVSKKNLPLKSI